MPTVFVKYHRGFEALFNTRFASIAKHVPVVHWLCGPTGCGKTRTAFSESEPLVPWISGSSLKWFDGYSDQEVAVFDDFRKEMCSFAWFLRLLDRNPVCPEVKGGHCYFNPRVIYITCPRLPEEEFVRHGAEGNVVFEDVQ